MIFFPPELRKAVFLCRENRFRAQVSVDGDLVAAHVPNSGRLGELLTPGAACYVTPSARERRATAFDLRLIRQGNELVSIDARLPNPLLADALARDALPAFHGYTNWQRERRWGASRFDFAAVSPSGQLAWVETKSVTLIEDRVARFPDAPTTRGARHVEELGKLAATGQDASVVFVVQRADAIAFGIHPTADLRFAAALSEAVTSGVRVIAYRCEVSLRGVAIRDEIPLQL